MLTVRMRSLNKYYSSLLRWQANIYVHITTTELHQWRYIVIFLECSTYFVVDDLILLFVAFLELLGLWMLSLLFMKILMFVLSL
jgi:hypothetical protein